MKTLGLLFLISAEWVSLMGCVMVGVPFAAISHLLHSTTQPPASHSIWLSHTQSLLETKYAIHLILSPPKIALFIIIDLFIHLYSPTVQLTSFPSLQIIEHETTVYCSVFSQDGEYLVCGGSFGKICVWKLSVILVFLIFFVLISFSHCHAECQKLGTKQITR
jgi:hypothetical protein